MAVIAFMTSTACPVWRTRLSTSLCPYRKGGGHRVVSMSGKGFGEKSVPKQKNNPSQEQPQQYEQPGVGKDYIPRGPTLSEDYERRGVIEPTLGPDSGILPEIVANRMLRRILTFGGIPLSLLFAFFAAYFVLKYNYDITVIPVVVAYSTLGTIGLATLGITYGIFSSSWDADKDGSRLGWEEAQTNLVRAKDGLFGARRKEKEEEKFEKIDRINQYRKKKKD